MNPKVTDGIMKVMSGAHRGVYKLTKGKLGNKFLGAPSLFLTVTGRKTGQPHTVPLMYLADGDRKVIVASKGGDDRHPVWYLNLVANPDVTVEVAGQQQKMTATVATPEEKAELWPKVVKVWKGYEGYQKKTERDIPLVILTER